MEAAAALRPTLTNKNDIAMLDAMSIFFLMNQKEPREGLRWRV